MTEKKTGLLVGIRFSDNDFWKTVTTFLHLFLHLDSRTDPASITKERVVDLFNRTAYGIYLLCQNGWRYEPSTDPGAADLTKYLTIEESDVFIGEDCIKFYIEASDNGDNGEFHYVDVDQGKVFSL